MLIKTKDEAIKFICNSYPEFKESQFDDSSFGWCNIVIKVDGKIIFRFPKDNNSYLSLKKEIQLLPDLLEMLPEYIKIPKFEYASIKNGYAHVGYRLIDGEFLTSEKLLDLSKNKQELLAKQLGEFFTILHQVDYTKYAMTPMELKVYYSEYFENIKRLCYPVFNQEEISLTEKIFLEYLSDESNFMYVPVLTHGDIHHSHVLYSDDTVGIIDFGDIRILDPAYDFVGIFYDYGIDFFNQVLRYYNGYGKENYEMKIRKFFLPSCAYYGVMYNIKEENDNALAESLIILRDSFGQYKTI